MAVLNLIIDLSSYYMWCNILSKIWWFTEKVLGHCQSNEVKVCIEHIAKHKTKMQSETFFLLFWNFLGIDYKC